MRVGVRRERDHRTDQSRRVHDRQVGLQSEDVWTVLNCPVPENLRKVRYQLHGRLTWAGFGTVQANLWIAPGRIDVEGLLDDIFPAEALGLVQAFHGAPTGPSSPEQLLRAAWDLQALRAAHRGFLDRWEAADPASAEALPQLLMLLDDWGQLLRTDPGTARRPPGRGLACRALRPDIPAPRGATRPARGRTASGVDGRAGLSRRGM